AVTVVRVESGCPLRAGNVITHANSRRVRSAEALERAFGDNGALAILRVRRAGTPLDIGAVSKNDVVNVFDYRAPIGEVIADAIRLYADGFVEQAQDAVRGLPENVSEAELSTALRALIAFTAGDQKEALGLLSKQSELSRPPGSVDVAAPEWTAPS